MTLSPRLAFFNIVATFAYLGLAILGGGGFATFFSHPALIALTIVLFALSGAGLFPGCARIAQTAGSSPPSG